jgi:hypothetical protein
MGFISNEALLLFSRRQSRYDRMIPFSRNPKTKIFESRAKFCNLLFCPPILVAILFLILNGVVMANQHNIRLRSGLQTLNCSASAFAALAAPPLVSRRISQQYMSQLIAGTREFESDEDAKEFFRVIDTMFHLQDIVVPKIPINWSDVIGVQDVLVQTFRDRRNIEDPIVVRPTYIRLNSLTWLKAMRENEPVPTYNYGVDGVAFEDVKLAEEVVRRLRGIGVASKIEPLTGDRRKSTITRSLEEIGFPVKEQTNDGTN